MDDTSLSASVEVIYRREVLQALSKQPPEFPDERILKPVVPFLWTAGRIRESLAAIRLLEQIEELAPRELNLRGYWELYEGDAQKALKTFQAALGQEPREQDFRLGYAYALFYLEDYQSAARVFQELVDEGTAFSSPAIMAAASRAMAAGQLPKEIQAAPLPNLPPGVSEILQIKLLYGPGAAIQEAERRLQNLAAEDQLPIQRLRIELELEARHERQISASIDDLLRRFFEDGTLWYLKGIAAARLRQRDVSHQAFQTATERAPLEARGWGAYGAGWVERQDFEKARAAYQVALFLDDRNPSFWSDLSMCEGAQGHYADAKHAVSRAIELGDHTFANYLNRGICSLNSGDVSAAIEDWERALVIEPDHRRAEEVRELLEKYAPDRDDRFAFGDLNLEEDKE